MRYCSKEAKDEDGDKKGTPKYRKPSYNFQVLLKRTQHQTQVWYWQYIDDITGVFLMWNFSCEHIHKVLLLSLKFDTCQETNVIQCQFSHFSGGTRKIFPTYLFYFLLRFKKKIRWILIQTLLSKSIFVKAQIMAVSWRPDLRIECRGAPHHTCLFWVVLTVRVRRAHEWLKAVDDFGGGETSVGVRG